MAAQHSDNILVSWYSRRIGEPATSGEGYSSRSEANTVTERVKKHAPDADTL